MYFLWLQAFPQKPSKWHWQCVSPLRMRLQNNMPHAAEPAACSNMHRHAWHRQPHMASRSAWHVQAVR